MCGTPRAGSGLLCEALRNTGLVGQPDDYFEPETARTLAERWGERAAAGTWSARWRRARRRTRCSAPGCPWRACAGSASCSPPRRAPCRRRATSGSPAATVCARRSRGSAPSRAAAGPDSWANARWPSPARAPTGRRSRGAWRRSTARRRRGARGSRRPARRRFASPTRISPPTTRARRARVMRQLAIELPAPSIRRAHDGRHGRHDHRRVGTAIRAMRFLVTGGAGFIGSPPRRAPAGARATRSWRSTTCRPAARQHRAPARRPPVPLHRRRRRGRAGRARAWLARLRRRRPPGGRGRRAADRRAPVRTIETNVRGTEVVLRPAAKATRQVVIASTSEVYGKSAALPFREDDDLVLGPTATSALGLRLQQDARRVPGARVLEGARSPVIVVRLFNTVGPRQTGRYGMVIPTFVQQALAGRAAHRLRRRHPVALLLVRRRRRARDPVARRAPAGGRGRSSTSARDEEITIRGLAERVKRLTGSASEIVTSPTTRPTTTASRTCSAACRTSRRSARSWAIGRPWGSTRSSPG